MDLIDQLKGLKGRSQPRRRRVQGEDAPPPSGSPPDPSDLIGRLGDAELIERDGTRLLLRRVRRDVSESPEAVSALLRPALGLDASPEEVVFLDSETTGLAGGTGTVAFMVGLAWWEDGQLAVEQGFMPDYGDEPALLAWLRERLAERRVLVSFNGKTFDMPLLRTRWRLQGERGEPVLPHLDLLHVVRRVYGHRLRSCGLSSVERFVLNDGRVDDVPGRAAPKAYFRYLDGHEVDTMAGVFRHNEVDLISTARLLARVSALYAAPERHGADVPGDWLGLAEWAEALEDVERAREIFTLALGALRDTPHRTRIELRLAELCERTGREDEAVELWRELAKREPLAGWPAVRALARWHEARQEWQGALEVLDRAWERFEQVCELRSHLGSSRLPAAWRQWMSDCERRRRDLRQAAHEKQLTLF